MHMNQTFGVTAMLTTMIGLGLVMGVYIHRDLVIRRHGARCKSHLKQSLGEIEFQGYARKRCGLSRPDGAFDTRRKHEVAGESRVRREPCGVEARQVLEVARPEDRVSQHAL